MSDTTTPKRNEAVARYELVIDGSVFHIRPNEHGEYVKHDAYAALQGEVSRLRELLDEVRCCFTRDDDLPDELLPRIDSLLEPPTDGR